MKPFNEFNERLKPDGSDDELQGVNDEGLGDFIDAVYKLRKAARFDKKEFQNYMEQAFYRSQDWPRDAKQVGKMLEQITKAAEKVSIQVDRWGR